ncbi:MAG: ABC transporter ATP-binding protein [Sphaerochaetaceae bacterium]|nr:ABC transporter ATP-binding protein [Sphaerochaetaceae bacterium]
MSLLEMKNLKCGYGHRNILDGINLKIESGEFCALLGLNGSGKTTLLRTVTGIIPALDGNCTVDGKDILCMNEKSRARLVSYIPQRTSPVSGISVLDYVLLGANPWIGLFDSPKAGFTDKALQITRRLSIFEMKDEDFSQLSEGQKQLAVFARVLLQDTPVMLMDEPDSALDFVNRHKILEKIASQVHESGKCAVISIHDPDFALTYCDRIFIVDGGKILCDICVHNADRTLLETGLGKIYGKIRLLGEPGQYCMTKIRN